MAACALVFMRLTCVQSARAAAVSTASALTTKASPVAAGVPEAADASAAGAAPAETVQSTLTSMLNSVEDVMFQLKEHAKVSHAREVVVATSAAARQRSVELLASAQERAQAVIHEIGEALKGTVNLPPLTLAELKKLADEEPTPSADGSSGDRRWASTLAIRLVDAIERSQAAVTSIADSVHSGTDAITGSDI